MLKTYAEIIARYPLLAEKGYSQALHESLILAAYLAGRADRLEEEVEKDTQKYLAAYKAAERG